MQGLVQIMALQIPEQRQNPDAGTGDLPLPGMPTPPAECAVEDCVTAGRVRYFPSYRLTLCDRHFIVAADKHRSERTYW